MITQYLKGEPPQPGCAAMSGSVTVVYDIVDEVAFRDRGNPLRYLHHGLKAHTVCAYDSVERYRQFREALERIADSEWAFDDASKIARAALRQSQNDQALP